MDFVVDAMNVIGTRADGWWRDRPAARRRLVDDLAAFASSGGHRVIVVFDGRAGHGDPPAGGARRTEGVSVRWAPGGPDAADHVIADLVAGFRDASAVTVVTSDAALVDAVRRSGAAVEPSRRFVSRLST
jgi:predicted RNA-binding protein with PIN domain